ncbi:hypothetical protein RhiirA4_400202, partial [Rhizophagus irregularis]
MKSTKSSSATTNQLEKSSKLLNLLRRVNTVNKSTSISNNEIQNKKMKMPLTKKGIKKFKDKLKYTQKLKQLELKKQLLKEKEKEQADKEKAKQTNFEKNLQYFTFSTKKV